MRKIFFAIMALALFACGGSTDVKEEKSNVEEGPDSLIYGLACDGSNDTVIILLPFVKGADPIVYNVEMAKRTGHIFGKPAIGDWCAVAINPEDSTEATMVINLDQLKGTWTHEVHPTWKDASKMSRRALRNKLADMPDSLRQAYMIPRHYGFTLKRSSIARAVGHVMKSSSLHDDSPVEYPEVKNYTGWKCRNGQLILTITEMPKVLKDGEMSEEKPKEHYDTLDFVFMNEDSLVLQTTAKEIVSYKRQKDAMSINAAAREAAMKTSTKILK